MATTLQITKMLVPSSKYDIKCPYSMNPTYITRHDTYNDASAMAEVSYMIGNNNQVSYHYAVDDYRAVQGIPTNRNAWHTGDGGSGTGNRNSIGVETCYSKSGGDRYTKAADNALTLIAMLMKEHGIPSTHVFYHRHWSGKNCPHRTIAQGITETQYQQMVQARYNEMYGGGSVVVNPLPETGTKYKVGDTVTINGIYTSSGSNTKLTPDKFSGTITKIIKGAANPYLLDNGNLGWVNDKCIVSGSSSSSSNGSSSSTTLKVGAKVKLSTSAKTYATGETIPDEYKGKTYTVQQLGDGKVLLKELYSWVKTSDIVGTSSTSSSNTSSSTGSSSTTIKVGAKVKLSTSAKTYATGETIPDEYKGKTYTVQEVGTGKVLLKELYSWVKTSDIVGSSSSSSASTAIKVGAKVTLLTSAKTYATGEAIPAQYKGKTYTVQQLGDGKVLLKELYSWVKTSDVK